ncbi:MAG: hypothetical protein JWM59_978 [Verrucomicrobiales bacterium]|nr:hypothetical protein [Verrucomicrobiales bacterium]
MQPPARDFHYHAARLPLIRHMAERSCTIRAWVGRMKGRTQWSLRSIKWCRRILIRRGRCRPSGSALDPRCGPVRWIPWRRRSGFFYGGMNWNECADWNLEGDQTVDFHVCDRDQLVQISAVLCAGYDWAPQLFHGWRPAILRRRSCLFCGSGNENGVTSME